MSVPHRQCARAPRRPQPYTHGAWPSWDWALCWWRSRSRSAGSAGDLRHVVGCRQTGCHGRHPSGATVRYDVRNQPRTRRFDVAPHSNVAGPLDSIAILVPLVFAAGGRAQELAGRTPKPAAATPEQPKIPSAARRREGPCLVFWVPARGVKTSLRANTWTRASAANRRRPWPGNCSSS